MSQQPTFASKTWRALRRTASGLGGSRKSADGGPVKLPSQRASSESAHEAKGAQNGHAPPSTLPTSREAFLEAYDAATLRGLNRIYQSNAACVADVPLQQVASWNRAPGFLVRKGQSRQQSCLSTQCQSQWVEGHQTSMKPILQGCTRTDRIVPAAGPPE